MAKSKAKAAPKKKATTPRKGEVKPKVVARPGPVASAEVAAPSPGDDHRDKMAARSREKSSKAREVGPPNPPADPVRRESCRLDFRLFCETYLSEWFYLGWGPDHLKAIAKIEAAVLTGERFGFAMPRSSGKTTLCEAAAIWALLYEHRRFLLVIGAEAGHATDIMGEIKEELEVNDLLDADFHEVTKYVRALEGISQRANGQTAEGERTRIEWSDSLVRFPSTKRRPRPSLIKVAGITGRIRGMKIRGHRPDLVIVDDPQTDKSATSIADNRSRLRVLGKAVLGLAGPKQQVAALMPTTVIMPGDMADQILDPVKYPRWKGERFKMVYAFPLAVDHWREYAERLGQVGGEVAATAYYVLHRAEMDAGAVVAWPDRFPEEKVSAIQHAMDLLIDSRSAFMAECQNEPEVERADGELVELDAGDLGRKLNNLPLGVVPRECNRLTAGVDVQGGCHFAVVTAWDSTFGGSIIDRIAFPRQNRTWFTNADARPSLATEFAELPEEARIYAGLKAIVEQILSRNYRQDGTGLHLRVELALIDSGKWTDVVYQFCTKSPFRDRLKPSKGKGIQAGDRPMNEWKHDPRRDRVGDGWRAMADAPGQHLMYDTNQWKTFVASRLAAPVPVAGALTLNGTDPTAQEMLASHLASEYQVETAGRGRELREWRKRPDGNENHWWDALVMSAVAASFNGLKWNTAAAAGDATNTEKKAKRKLSDLVAEKRAGGPTATDPTATNGGRRKLSDVVAEKRKKVSA